MKVLTEIAMRQLWRQHKLKNNCVIDSDTVLTPSARSFLKERGITLTTKGKPQVNVQKINESFYCFEPNKDLKINKFFAFQYQLKALGNDCIGFTAYFPQWQLTQLLVMIFQLIEIQQNDVTKEIKFQKIDLIQQYPRKIENKVLLNYWLNKLFLTLERLQVSYLALIDEIPQFKETDFDRAYSMITTQLTDFLLNVQNHYLQGGVRNSRFRRNCQSRCH